MMDLYEHELRGTSYKVRLDCGHQYEFYNHVYEGTRMINSPLFAPTEASLCPNGLKRRLSSEFTGFQRMADGAILPAGSGIFCPMPTCYKIKMVTHIWIDVDWIEHNPYTKYIGLIGMKDD